MFLNQSLRVHKFIQMGKSVHYSFLFEVFSVYASRRCLFRSVCACFLPKIQEFFTELTSITLINGKVKYNLSASYLIPDG